MHFQVQFGEFRITDAQVRQIEFLRHMKPYLIMVYVGNIIIRQSFGGGKKNHEV